MNTAEQRFGEVERLAVVDATGLLGSESEERFDRIVRLAAYVFNVPMAFFSVLGADRQWFKARFGVEMQESSRNISFCQHALASDGAFIVSDAREDVRFAANPLVTDGPRIRFYAGHPVKSPEGVTIGTMCIADRRPWAGLPDRKVAALRDLASLIESEIARRGLLREAAPPDDRESALLAQLRAMLDSELTGEVVVDSSLNVSCFNAAMSEYIALTDDSIGRPIAEHVCLMDYPTLHQDLLDAAEHGHGSSQSVNSLSGRVVRVNLTPFREPQATRYHVLISTVDMTPSRDAEQLASVLDGLGAHQLCALDRRGVIVYTNDAWDADAEKRDDPLHSKTGPGANYLESCHRWVSAKHRPLVEALREVIDGRRSAFTFSYADTTVPGEAPRFFLLHACAVPQDDISAVISHTDITAFVGGAHAPHPAIWD